MLIKRTISLLLFIHLPFSLLSARMEDHYKKAKNKIEACKIRNIDYIYMINLDQRPEKYQKSCEQLHPYGVYPYRFSAVNGWELPLSTLQDVGVKFSKEMQGGYWGTSYLDDSFEPHHELIGTVGRTYFSHCMSRGAIGICLSHLSVIYDAYISGYKTVWILEDDIEVIKNPNIISDLILKLDQLVKEKKCSIGISFLLIGEIWILKEI